MLTFWKVSVRDKLTLCYIMIVAYFFVTAEPNTVRLSLKACDQAWTVTPGGDGFIPCKTKVGIVTSWNKNHLRLA